MNNLIYCYDKIFFLSSILKTFYLTYSLRRPICHLLTVFYVFNLLKTTRPIVTIFCLFKDLKDKMNINHVYDHITSGDIMGGPNK